MLPDRVSNPGPLTYESGALPIALRGPAAETLNGRSGYAADVVWTQKGCSTTFSCPYQVCTTCAAMKIMLGSCPVGTTIFPFLPRTY